MARYRIRLGGPGIEGPRIAGAVLRDLLDVLVDGARRAVRFRVEGRSTARGTQPSWVAAGAAFDVLALDKGSAVVDIEAPPLEQTLTSLLPQYALFEEVDGTRTGLDLLTESLADAATGVAESDRYDIGLLQKFEELDRVFQAGVSAIQIVGGHHLSGEEGLTISPESVENLKRLREETPPPQRVRVAGRLNVIRHSDRMFSLILESGTTLRGIAEGLGPAALAQYFGRHVVVSGTAIFRPSGRVQSIEADAIEQAEGDVSLWAEEPRPLFHESLRKDLIWEQGPRSGISAIIGRWPGDEPDDEIHVRLQELS